MIWRSILSFSFASMLVLTSQALAAARGAAAATGSMVICAGEGTITVYTDADGAPVASPHICPECIVTTVLTIPNTPLEYPQTAIRAAPSFPVCKTCMPATPATGWHSRAPPCVI